jgi:hypothetical protein
MKKNNLVASKHKDPTGVTLVESRWGLEGRECVSELALKWSSAS